MKNASNRERWVIFVLIGIIMQAKKILNWKNMDKSGIFFILLYNEIITRPIPIAASFADQPTALWGRATEHLQ